MTPTSARGFSFTTNSNVSLSRIKRPPMDLEAVAAVDVESFFTEEIPSRLSLHALQSTLDTLVFGQVPEVKSAKKGFKQLFEAGQVRAPRIQSKKKFLVVCT